MVRAVFGKDEIKPGKQSDDKKQNQRVGKRQQETGDGVCDVIVGRRFGGGFERTCGVFSEQVYAEGGEYYASKDL